MRLSLRHGQLGNRVVYLLSIVVALVAAFLLRFDFNIPPLAFDQLRTALLIAIPLKIAVFHLDRLHRTWNRFTGTGDLMNLVCINFIASAAASAAIFWIIGREFPRSIYILDFVICSGLTVSFMLAVQFRFSARRNAHSRKGRKHILIYGAGAAGNMLLKETIQNPTLGFHVEGFLDDDPAKKGCVLSGVSVFGLGRDAAHVLDRLKRHGIEIDEIIVVLPSASGRQMR